MVDKIYFIPNFLADSLDKPMDQAVYFTASIVAIAACFYLKRLKNERTKRTFSTCVGLLIHFFTFGKAAWASILQNLLSYSMMAFLPSKHQHIAVFVTSATVLGSVQLHKQIYQPGVNGLDVTMVLMFNFCRVTSLVCSVKDGQALRHGAELKKREKEFVV